MYMYSFRLIHEISCNRIFSVRDQFHEYFLKNINVDETLNESDEDDAKYKCDICKEKFENEANLTNHKWLHNASSRWKYSCTFCQNRFQHELGLKKHIFQKHHGCYVCNIDFSSRSMLESHITKSHEGKLYVFRNRKIVTKERYPALSNNQLQEMKEMVLKIPKLDDKIIAQYTSKKVYTIPKSSGRVRGRPRKMT